MTKMEAPCYTCLEFFEIAEEDKHKATTSIILCHQCLAKIAIEDLERKEIDGQKCVLIKKGIYKIWKE